MKKYLVLFALAMQGCSLAANIPEVAELKPIEPLVETRKIYFEGIESKIQNKNIGQRLIVFFGACITPGGKNRRSISHDNPFLDDAIKDEIIEHGYDMANRHEAEVLLSANVTNIVENVCDSAYGVKAVTYVDITWKAYDKATKKSQSFQSSGKSFNTKFDKILRYRLIGFIS